MTQRRIGNTGTALGLLAGLLWATAAAAQAATQVTPMTPAGTPPVASSRYLLTAPLYDTGAGSPYDLNGPVVASGPPGKGVPVPPVPDFSFTEFAKNIHGYVSAGIATHGGHEFSGGVMVPLAPNAELFLSGSSSQIGGYRSLTPGGGRGTAHFDTYSIGLHVQPAENVDAYIGLHDVQARGPFGAPGWPYWAH